jgi:hypothetical protein
MATTYSIEKRLNFAGLQIDCDQIKVGTAVKDAADLALLSATPSLTSVTATNIDAGSSGVAGTVDIFPTTAAKGKIALTAADSAGDTTTTIVNASQAGARTYTIPDAGASASFVMTAGAQTIAGAKTFSSDITLGAATTLNLDSTTATLSSNAATITKYAAQITTESLTTAAGASQAFVITLTGAAATDLAFVTRAGGTNTRQNFAYNAVMTTNTCTVTVYNNEPANALNGTLIFNLWIVKA